MKKIFKFLTKSGNEKTEIASSRRTLLSVHAEDKDPIDPETLIDYTPFVFNKALKERIRNILSKNGIDDKVISALLD